MEFRSKDRPFMIAGPCSAETRDQVLETAEGLKSLNIDLLRAGIWKPRTRPGNFEGVGEEAIAWLKEAGELIGKPITVEVANSAHVELALKGGVDVLWIGARTTVNPFMIQEIADALAGTNIPVLVKNPVNPDVELWIGAIERFQSVGLKHIGAIHRGFSTFQKSPFRNSPNWNIPIELKRRMPGLPIICDPSHICGNKELLGEVAQKAIDLNMDGLMLETHRNPLKAWSDAEQQITPLQLGVMLSELIWRNPNSLDLEVKAKLEELRSTIDGLDRDILDRLMERLEVSRNIGAYKKEHNITIFQQQRWNEILHDRQAYIEGKELSPRFLTKFLDAIHEESIQQQTEVMNSKNVEES
ncbi:MAG: bifunctional 3-deoxy-7-phosphoheptulonate synthase/chorismate mutase type II [Flavobacteriales bacterium]|nr:bifunctional 3-deoxy-7-phosphoheptulonate synthase/chorismate mutase type II [Flavobacteriales bacterium]